MILHLPDSLDENLRQRASQAGFASVEEYAITILTTGQPTNAALPSGVPLTPEELEASARQCDIGMAQCKSGNFRSVEELLAKAEQRISNDVK